VIDRNLETGRSPSVTLLSRLAALKSARDTDGRGRDVALSPCPDTDFERVTKPARTPKASATDAEKLFRGLGSSSTSEIGDVTLSRATVVDAREEA
jgi:hypothetical protein